MLDDDVVVMLIVMMRRFPWQCMVLKGQYYMDGFSRQSGLDKMLWIDYDDVLLTEKSDDNALHSPPVV